MDKYAVGNWYESKNRLVTKSSQVSTFRCLGQLSGTLEKSISPGV